MKYSISGTNYYYLEGEKINSGGFGNIYECSMINSSGHSIQSDLVLKRLQETPGVIGVEPHRFEREMRYLEKLSHQYILKPLYYDYTNEFIVMERYPMNLNDFINKSQLLEEEIYRIFNQILEGAKYYVSEGVLHRDLKPQNILIDNHSNIKIADFGLSSKIYRDHTMLHLTRTNASGGTEFYTAPEQLENLSEADIRSEIYSLGKILYVLLTGHTRTLDMNMLQSLKPEQRYLINRATKRYPEERFQTLEDFIKSYNLFSNESKPLQVKLIKLEQIILMITDLINNPSSTYEMQNVFAIINHADFEYMVDILVTLDSHTHKILWHWNYAEYNNFVNRACQQICETGYIFSYVDTIVSSIVTILDQMHEVLDIEVQTHLIKAAVEVSTSHNRFWSMEHIGKYIEKITNPVILVELKSGVNLLDSADVSKISIYNSSENIRNLKS